VPADQNYPMAAIVAGALDGGLPPSEWGVRRSQIPGPAADLDESYTPRPASARVTGRASFSSQRTRGQRSPER
jgi:hypothetical protein